MSLCSYEVYDFLKYILEPKVHTNLTELYLNRAQTVCISCCFIQTLEGGVTYLNRDLTCLNFLFFFQLVTVF